MPGGQGGWFTYYLIKGLRGDANSNQDPYIDVEELSSYVEEKVSASTKGEQTPMSHFGEKDMIVAYDESRLYERIQTVIIQKYWLGKIKEENFEIFMVALQKGCYRNIFLTTRTILLLRADTSIRPYNCVKAL